MSSDALRWKIAANPVGPFADINQDFASIWIELDSYGRVHHVTGDLVQAERLLQKIRAHFLEKLHEAEIPINVGEIVVDGLPGGRNRMIVSFYFSPINRPWDEDAVTTALGGFGIRDYKPLPQ